MNAIKEAVNSGNYELKFSFDDNETLTAEFTDKEKNVLINFDCDFIFRAVNTYLKGRDANNNQTVLEIDRARVGAQAESLQLLATQLKSLAESAESFDDLYAAQDDILEKVDKVI